MILRLDKQKPEKQSSLMWVGEIEVNQNCKQMVENYSGTWTWVKLEIIFLCYSATLATELLLTPVRWDEALHDDDHETQVRDDDHENTENTDDNTGMRDWAEAGGKN